MFWNNTLSCVFQLSPVNTVLGQVEAQDLDKLDLYYSLLGDTVSHFPCFSLGCFNIENRNICSLFKIVFAERL